MFDHSVPEVFFLFLFFLNEKHGNFTLRILIVNSDDSITVRSVWKVI